MRSDSIMASENGDSQNVSRLAARTPSAQLTRRHPDGTLAPMTDAQTTRAVTLPEAQRLLGVSRRTVQRMLQDGRLHGVKHGERWAIEVPAGTPAAPQTTPRTDADVLAELRQSLAVVTAQRDAATSERDYLRQVIAALTTKLPAALPAPVEAATPAQPRSLWQRLRGR